MKTKGTKVDSEINEFTKSEMPKAVKKWGGLREGSGRKPTGLPPKATVTFYIDADCKRKYMEMKRRGVKMSARVEECINSLAAALGIE